MPAKKTNKTKKKSASATKKTVKKTTKKAPAKKKTASANKVKPSKKKTVRKAVKKKPAKKTCGCKTTCASHEAFWVNNGPVLHSLQDLLDALHNMSDEQFEHHTAQGRNDFANWIKECLCDRACATSVKRVRTRVGAVRVLSNKCSC